MLGGADANGDGLVSDEELAAFVDLASAGVKNPLFRPKVYARPPNGDDWIALFDLRGTQAVELAVSEPSQVRLQLRDANGVRWLDVDKELGANVTLHLAVDIADGMVVERLPLAGGDAKLVRLEVGHHPGAGTLPLSSLPPSPVENQRRGAENEALRSLFSRPFGPHAVAQFLAARANQPEPVFGISKDDADGVAPRRAERSGCGSADQGGLRSGHLSAVPHPRTAYPAPSGGTARGRMDLGRASRNAVGRRLASGTGRFRAVADVELHGAPVALRARRGGKQNAQRRRAGDGGGLV